jgi:prepilin-type N-terminal cleavage/methylation domain-containing protein
MHIARDQPRYRIGVGASRGFTLTELVVTFSILAVLILIALPRWDARRLNILEAQRMALADLRLARSSAITTSMHFQVTFPAVTYMQVARMKEEPAGSGTWVVDSNHVQDISLPSGTQVKLSGTETLQSLSVEFNSRGLAMGLAAPQSIDLQDSFGRTKSLQVWPSGQVNAL